MIEQLKILKEVIINLEELEIDYMLTGSVALAVYAEPRMTRDIDIVVAISSKHTKSLIKAFSIDFYIDDEAIELAIQYEKMFNILHHQTGMKIDFIIKKNNPFEINKFVRRKKTNIDGFFCYIISRLVGFLKNQCHGEPGRTMNFELNHPSTLLRVTNLPTTLVRMI